VVYADDHRGHGRTARSDAELGVFSAERGWRKLIDDLGRVSERALAEHPGLPVVFLGHSMGSFTAQQVAFERGGDFAGGDPLGDDLGAQQPPSRPSAAWWRASSAGASARAPPRRCSTP
jgi:pimeloyl-ACP methyl ester carboxylesterase